MHQCHRSVFFFFFLKFNTKTKTSIRLSLTPLEESIDQSLDGGLNYDLTVPFNDSFMIRDDCVIIQTTEQCRKSEKQLCAQEARRTLQLQGTV